MECKYLILRLLEPSLEELIDTLWNVNKIKYGNVLAAIKRINRYIMECKLAY